MGEDIQKYLTTQLRPQKEISEQIGSIFTNNNEIVSSTQLISVSGDNLCKMVSKLRKRQELCTELDSGIPIKGIKQAYFRISQFLSLQIPSVIGAGSDKLKELANKVEFKEVEYTFENLYSLAFDHVIEMLFSEIRSYIDTDIELNT